MGDQFRGSRNRAEVAPGDVDRESVRRQGESCPEGLPGEIGEREVIGLESKRSSQRYSQIFHTVTGGASKDGGAQVSKVILVLQSVPV